MDAGLSLLANGPQGEELALGYVQAGSVTVCGEHLYWLGSNGQPGDTSYPMRWKPGAGHLERLLVQTESSMDFGQVPVCVAGVVNLQGFSTEPDAEALLVLDEPA